MTVSLRPIDRTAAARLKVLRDRLGTWERVGKTLNVNKGECYHVASGQRRASRVILANLGLGRKDVRIRVTLTTEEAWWISNETPSTELAAKVDRAIAKHAERSAALRLVEQRRAGQDVDRPAGQGHDLGHDAEVR